MQENVCLNSESSNEEKNPYQFKKYPEGEPLVTYVLINLLDNPFRMKAYISEHEYKNKIPKLNQIHYKILNKE